MQSFHQFSRPKEGGLIHHYALADWWAGTFNVEERGKIEHICDSDGEMLLAQGRIWESSGNAVKLLNGLYSDLMAADQAPLALKVLLKSYELACREAKPLDLHHTCEHVIEAYENPSSDQDDALHRLVEASEIQIGIALDVARILAEAGHRSLPRHRGYTTLTRIREDEADYAEAIRIAEQAKAEGWQGEWGKLIKRCRKQDGQKPRKKFLFEFRDAKSASQKTEHGTPGDNDPQISTNGGGPTKTLIPEPDSPQVQPTNDAQVKHNSISRVPPGVKTKLERQASRAGTPPPPENFAAVDDRIRECEVTIRRLQANLSASREELRNTASSKERLLEEREIFESSERETANSLYAARQRARELERALDEETTLRTNAQNESKARAEKLEELEGEVNAAHELLNEVSEEQNDLQRRLTEQEELLVQTNERAEHRQALADTLREDLERAKDRDASFKASLERLDGQLGELEEAWQAAEGKLAEKISRIEVLERELESRKERTVDLTVTLARLDGETDRLRASLEERGQQRDALAVELQETREKALQHAQFEAKSLRKVLHEREHSTILSPDWDYEPYSTASSDEQSHVHYDCPSCKRSLRIPKEFVGWYGKCKFCGSDMRVQRSGIRTSQVSRPGAEQ